MENTTDGLNPIRGNERIEVLDSIRGFAILGILLVNMFYYFWPIQHLFGIGEVPGGVLNDAAAFIVRLVAQSKFFTMFSMLFGLGMAVQMERIEARGKAFRPFFARRMIALLLIGCAHGLLLFSGDILTNYAVVGLILMWFARLKRKTLLWVAIPMYLLTASVMSLMMLGFTMAQVSTEEEPPAISATTEEATDNIPDFTFGGLETWDHSMDTHLNGSIPDLVSLRAGEVLQLASMLPIAVWMLLAANLFGVWAWRSGIFHEPEKHRVLLRRLLIWGGSYGLLCSLIFALFSHHENPIVMWAAQTALGFGQFLHMFAYVAGMLLLFQAGRCKALFDGLAAVGRMALSNYLGQSLIFSLIADGYGLGFFAQPGYFICLLMTLIFFVAQIYFSKWWLSHFRFGPAEWLWRCMTYGKLQPMRRA